MRTALLLLAAAMAFAGCAATQNESLRDGAGGGQDVGSSDANTGDGRVAPPTGDGVSPGEEGEPVEPVQVEPPRYDQTFELDPATQRVELVLALRNEGSGDAHVVARLLAGAPEDQAATAGAHAEESVAMAPGEEAAVRLALGPPLEGASSGALPVALEIVTDQPLYVGGTLYHE